MDPQTTYSLGEALFFLTGVLVAPAFALGGLFVGPRRLSILTRAAIPFFAVEATLVVIAAVVYSMHPDYPANGPPERYLALLVITAHLAGAAAVHVLRRYETGDDEEARTPGVIWVVVISVWGFSTLLTVVFGMTVVMPPRLALPDDASNIEERLVGRGLSTAHQYDLGADMSAESFETFGERLGMPASGPDFYRYADERCEMKAFFDGSRMRFRSRCQ